MPKGPRGEKRPADVNAAAVAVAKIATGEAEEDFGDVPARAAGGKKGGRKRADSLTPSQRKAIAKKAADARWGDKS